MSERNPEVSTTPALGTEVLAGITTFLTMSYIVVVNPAILSTPGTGMSFTGVMTATVVLSFLCTLLMGLWARIPYAVAPGMGLNAFFAFTIILGNRVPWPVALGIVFWSGVLFLALSLTPARTAIAEAIPVHVRGGAAVGIGILLTFLGFKSLGLVVANPVTLVSFGPITTQALVALAGMLGMVVLLRRKSPFAFLAGIAGITLTGVLLGWVKAPPSLVAAPDFTSVFLKLDFLGSLRLAFLPAILSIVLTDLFDSLSTFVGLAHASGLKDDRGEPLRVKEGLTVDAIATLVAGLLGTSAGTAYIESAAGIEVGGRTGRTSVVTALCFLPLLVLSPLAGMVPAYATAPVLILIGALLFRSVRTLAIETLEEAVPAFLVAVLIPLTFSITQGLLWGFLAHTALFVVCGRAREVRPMMWVLAAFSILLLVLEARG
ncbi:MAG: NCS2 family permease [Thermoanaerobaculia bacterium]